MMISCDAPTADPGMTNVFGLLRLLPMSDRDKHVEILALRHQAGITPGRVMRPRQDWKRLQESRFAILCSAPYWLSPTPGGHHDDRHANHNSSRKLTPPRPPASARLKLEVVGYAGGEARS